MINRIVRKARRLLKNISKILFKKSYYKMQQPNLLSPNEDYINSLDNKNKADLIRMSRVFELNKHLTGRMLDIGCNDGFLMRHFDWKFDEYVGIDMFSIDTYTHGRYNANKMLYTKNGKINYITGLLEDLDLSSLGKFDFIFAGEIIEHLEKPSSLLKAIQNLLTANVGGGVIYYNNAEQYWR